MFINDWIDLFKEIYLCECVALGSVAWMIALCSLAQLHFNFLQIVDKLLLRLWFKVIWILSPWWRLIIANEQCARHNRFSRIRIQIRCAALRISRRYYRTTVPSYAYASRLDHFICNLWKSVPRLVFYLNLCIVRTTPKFSLIYTQNENSPIFEAFSTFYSLVIE